MTPGGGMGCFIERTGAFCYEDSLIIAEKNMTIAKLKAELAEVRDSYSRLASESSVLEIMAERDEAIEKMRLMSEK